MTEVVWLNGRLMPAPEARISVFDAGLSHGAGLFETMRAYGGKVMRLDEHLQRLSDSAVTLELQIDLNREAVRQGIAELLEANRLRDARLRLLATPGNVPRPGRPSETPAPPMMLITCGPVHAYPPELYTQGMRVCICPYRQNRLDPLAGHKTLAYLPRLLAMKEAADRRCNESLWFTMENRLAEGSICNAFIVREGTIATPPLDTPVLPGTVRRAVIELARENRIDIEETAIDIDGLLAAEEVFLTGSVMEIMPVTSIEKHEVGKGVPGEITRRIRELYAGLIAKECGVGA